MRTIIREDAHGPLGGDFPLRGQVNTHSCRASEAPLDGWISLPSSLRISLSLRSGDRLEADLVDGALVLRTLATRDLPRGGISCCPSRAFRAIRAGRERRAHQAWARTAAKARPVRRCGSSPSRARPAAQGSAARADISRQSPDRPGAAKPLKKAELAVTPTRDAVASPPCWPGGSDRTAACSRSSAARSATSRYDRSGQVVGTPGRRFATRDG